jgi:hypothetical protein
MKMNALAFVGLLAACATLNEPPKTYEQIRAAIIVGTDSVTGQQFASSEAAAKEDIDRTTMTYGAPDEAGNVAGVANIGGRSISKRYFLATRQADGGVRIFVETYSSRQITEAELQDKPWTETSPKYAKAWVGTPLRETKRELVEFANKCKGSRLDCVRIQRDRIALSDEDIRAALNNPKREDIPVGIYERSVDWRMPYDELAATLDALGVSERFR